MKQVDDKLARAARATQAMAGRSINWLATSVGVAPSTAHGYVNKGLVPPADVAFRVAEALGVDVRWYVTGQGAPVARADGAISVPLVDPEFVASGSVEYSLELVSGLGAGANGLRCLLQQGKAMRPSVPEHAEILFGPMPASGPVDGRVYVLSFSGRAVVRRVRLSSDGSWETVCDNPAFRSEPRERIPAGAFAGEVLWVSHRP